MSDGVVRIAPPIAKQVATVRSIHGYEEVDHYAWMMDKTKTDAEVLGYLKAETEYAEACMISTTELQERLYREMLGRIRETDENVPYRKGEYFYFSRTEEGRQYPIFCRKRGGLEAAEEITLDMNLMAEGKDYFSIGEYEVSDDGNLLAFATDETGFRQYTLFVKDLRTGAISEPLAERVTGVAWATDGLTLFYVQEDEVTKRSNLLFRHELGSRFHERLFEESDELYRLDIERTRSGGYVTLTSASFTTSEVRYLEAANPTMGLRLLMPRREGHEYYLDHTGDAFFVRTNDRGKNFRLIEISEGSSSEDEWPKDAREIVPLRSDVMLEDVECFASHFLTIERENGLTVMSVFDRRGGESHRIDFPEPVYVASPQINPEFGSVVYRFNYESLVTPRSLFEYDLTTRERRLLKQHPVLGGYDQADYKSERLFATASDGTHIPISIVYRRGAKPGPRPLLLEGYGSYGISNDVDFSSNRLSLLDRGMIYGVAHIRGGGEMGKEWHDQGKMMHKQNSFTDFISSAEWLIESGYTTTDQLIITGGSAGGLLMGAVANLRPELFRAVVSYVPFVDVMNTMLDDSLPLTVGEYLEWGNPNEKAAWEYMRSYSPYENIEAKHYPTMLVRTSLNDSQVMYWEPAKYVARLRAMKRDDNLLLFKVKLEPGGHGGASGRYDRLKDSAFDYAFILGQIGIDR